MGEKLSFERVQFRMSQLRDRSNNEDRLRKALGQTDDMLASTVTEDQKWKNTERNWQLYMAESKKSLLEDDLAQYRYFVPDLLIKDVHYPSTPVSGKIRLQIFNIDFTDLKYKDDLESLVVQVIIDSKASEPIKFKRRIPCDLRTTGVSFDLNQAQSFELLVFDKLAKLKGFVFFRLSWMMEYMEGTFDKVFKEKMELVSRGTIELSIRNQTTSTLIEPLQNGIFRKKAIKRKIYKRLGHEFVSHGQGALILKCAHCSDLIYTATSAYCRSIDFQVMHLIVI